MQVEGWISRRHKEVLLLYRQLLECFECTGWEMWIDGETYTSRVSANSVVTSYVYTIGTLQVASLHPVLERSYVAGVCYKCFRIVGSGVCGTISVDIPSETS